MAQKKTAAQELKFKSVNICVTAQLLPFSPHFQNQSSLRCSSVQFHLAAELQGYPLLAYGWGLELTQP